MLLPRPRPKSKALFFESLLVMATFTRIRAISASVARDAKSQGWWGWDINPTMARMARVLFGLHFEVLAISLSCEGPQTAASEHFISPAPRCYH